MSEWEGIKKPDPAIFKKALQQLNVLASESMFVGDHPQNDVKGAINIGMIGVWKKERQWKEVEADYIINDLKELPVFVSAINKG